MFPSRSYPSPRSRDLQVLVTIRQQLAKPPSRSFRGLHRARRGRSGCPGAFQPLQLIFQPERKFALVSKRLARLTCLAVLAGAMFGLTTAAAASAAALQGAGSTLVAPIEAEWAAAWAQSTGNAAPSYDAVGSGTGLSDIAKGLVDFGASDAPLSASTTPCNGCYQIPWALSATGVSFNVPGVHRLHLTGSVLAGIYLGHITRLEQPRDHVAQQGRALPEPGDHRAPPLRRLGRLVRVHGLPLVGQLPVAQPGRPRDQADVPRRPGCHRQQRHGLGCCSRPVAGSPTSRSRT